MLDNALKCTDITIAHDKSQIGIIHDINDCKINNKKKTDLLRVEVISNPAHIIILNMNNKKNVLVIDKVIYNPFLKKYSNALLA